MLEGNTIGFVGGGNMAEALISGIVRGGATNPQDVYVAEKHPQRAAYLVQTYGIRSCSLAELADAASIVVIAVKPQVVDEVLGDLAGRLGDDDLIVTVAAGVPTSRFEAVFPDTPVVRVMPNTPALVSEGMSVIAAGANASRHHLGFARAILATTGKVLELDEAKLDAVTAVSGTGPAYFFYLAEALVDAAERVGLSREDAATLVVQTAVGAAAMLRDSGRDAVQLREQVTSPGGTTAAGIGVLEERGARELFTAMVTAARDRSVELGGGPKP